MAAAHAWGGVSGPLDPTHAMTVLAAHQRLSLAGSKDEAWISAVAAAVRLSIDGARVDPASRADAVRPLDSPRRGAWRARARRPGPDVHDLKFCEAVANAPLPPDLFARVSALAARSGRLVDVGWPELDAAVAAYASPRAAGG